MSAEERRRRILETVRQRGTMRVTELGAELGVAPVTARRDVEALAGRGLVRRVHGSVSWPGHTEETQGASASAFVVGSGSGSGSGPVLGMVVPSAAYYFAAIVRGAQAAASAAGARLALGISGYQRSEDGIQVDRLLSSGVDGLLITPSWEPDAPVAAQADHFLALGVPCVLVERRVSATAAAAEMDRVCSDHTHGAFLAVRHLVSLGHRRIALAAHLSPTASLVRAGYLASLALLELGEPPVPIIDTYPAEANPEGMDAALERLINAVHDDGVTAVLVHNDEDAIKIVQSLADRGVQVPGDLSVIAYDNEVAALADTPLTAVSPPKYEVGTAAVELLLSRLSAAPDPAASARRHLDLLPRLVVRDSCGPLAP
ncbi:substrate-binding domain-containing protein [Catenulispora rubra]|uniref:substrate-binding domain-containing protein n=1 Tax=Catenulispora rubra TaxID=280293 RepID=UPI001E5C9349|nr:substrate-binding domain-containing protein [Catenulispora rubra]